MLIIGELINATRKTVKEAIITKNKNILQEMAISQDLAGADYIDVNVATGVGKLEQETEDMKWAIKAVCEVTKKPLAIDTTNIKALEAGLDEHGPGAMINSISAETGRLEPFLKLAREYNCVAIALPVDDNGVSRDVLTRLKIAREILEAAEKEGFPKEKFYFDPLALPLSIEESSGIDTLKTLRSLKKEFGVKTTVGLSNVSFGIPKRGLINRTFLTLALYLDLDSAILNPLDRNIISSLYAAMVFLGKDPYCVNYLRAFREGKLFT